LGTEIVVELLRPAELTVHGDRIELPPPGVDGGHAGAPGTYAVERADGSVEVLPTKHVGVQLQPGDRFVMRTSGGGGVGPPEDRARELVQDDMRSGRVTRDGAARDYAYAPEP
jgi:N-methylhydantoinase B